MIKTEIIKIYTCSKCGCPNSSDPSRCCRDGDFKGEKREIEIPKVSGRYYTIYFDTEYQKEIGKLIRSAKIKEKFKEFIYTNKQYKIQELYQSLEKVYSYFREETYHHAECEFALGTSCWCWCNGKYHGMRGKGAKIIQQK